MERLNRRINSVLLVVLPAAIASCCVAQSAPPQAIFIDRSGSMKGYYASGLVDSIVAPLNQTVGAHGKLEEYAFSTEVSAARSLAEIRQMPFGNLTFLDRVIDASERKHLQIAWIVTDNIEDTGEAGDTQRFYERLRGDDVARVTVFPVLSRAGEPGLIVYALLFDPAAGRVYEDTLSGFEQGGAGVLRTEPLRMKPVNRDTVEVTSHSLTPLTRRGRPKEYETGTPIRESAEVRFKSALDHILIVDSTLHVLQAAPTFEPGSLLVPERRVIAVTPNRVSALGPGSETAQVYQLSVDIGRVTLKNSPAAWWKAAWGKSDEEAQLDLTFQIDVPHQNFRLTPKFLTQYSAATVQEARSSGKVYALDSLMSQVNAGDTRITLHSPVFFRVKYPAWPAFLWLFLLALIAASLAGIAVLLRRLLLARKVDWSVTAKARGGYALEANVEGDRVIVEGEAVGRIERNRLYPLGSATLEGGRDNVPIEPGVPIAAGLRSGACELVFTEKSESSSGASAAGAAVSSGTIRRR